jgi:hypothetical protein
MKKETSASKLKLNKLTISNLHSKDMMQDAAGANAMFGGTGSSLLSACTSFTDTCRPK